MIARPAPTEYGDFYKGYVDTVPSGSVIEQLEDQRQELLNLMTTLDDEQGTFRYAEGKWSIKEVIGHLIDCERVFAYRAMCIARGDTLPLPGFNENAYVNIAAFNRRTLHELAEEYKYQRYANVALFRSFDDEALRRVGTASGLPCSVRALIYIIVGHERHHLNILRQRYLARLLGEGS